jgi:hypothetical protein
MTLRENNPEQFMMNVYYSWSIMEAVVKNIEHDCAIVHEEPIEGVGYDCLCLYEVFHDNSVRLKFMLNRNGVNSNVLDRVWDRVKEVGVHNVADELIDICEFMRSDYPRVTAASRLCDQVLTWINEHPEDNFYVGPLNWSGSCEKFLDIAPIEYPNETWPFRSHGPDISCGVNRVEMDRFVFELAENELRSESATSGELASGFSNLQQALATWMPMKSRPEVWPEITGVIDSLKHQLGEIKRIHIPVGDSYIAVTFVNEPKRIGAYINVGFIDHVVETEGSYVPDNAPTYWRSPLTTASGSRSKSVQDSVETQLCPNCFIKYRFMANAVVDGILHDAMSCI